jgi:hypothetical protein
MLTGLRLGTIRGFSGVTYLADVEIEGYVSTYLTGVPVAFHVREDLVTDGTACLVALLDPLNPRAAVVVALFDGRPAEDPRFDPVVGHKHRGLVGDGPELA